MLGVWVTQSISKRTDTLTDVKAGQTKLAATECVCLLSVDNKLFGFKHRGTLRSSS